MNRAELEPDAYGSGTGEDATRLALDGYLSRLSEDGTRVSEEGYRSLVATRQPASAAEDSELFRVGDWMTLRNGRAKVLAILCGAMGVVYGVFEEWRQSVAAYKMLRRRFTTDRQMQELFAQEAAVWVRLGRHPYIVQAHLVDRVDGQPYVRTDYIRGDGTMGGDLRAWLGHPSLTLPLAVEMGLQIAQGMQHALSRVPGVVHRDLKPAKVLVAASGRACVTDFGLVRAAEADAGTPAHIDALASAWC
jgi:hypothetical protein